MKNTSFGKAMHRIDQKLLLNRRLLWETKIHYLLLFIAANYLLSTLAGLFAPVSLDTDFPGMGGIVTLFVIVNILAFCYWIYRQSQYSIEEQFGVNFKFIEQFRFLIYFGGTALLVAQPFIPQLIVNYKINNLISFEELREDVAILNEGNIYFPTSVFEDNPDNIFSVRDGVSNYPYKNNMYGNVEGIGENWERSEGYDSSNDPTKEDLALLVENAKKPENIAKIERFLEVFSKYDKEGLRQLENKTAKEILEDFRAETVGIGDRIIKYAVEARISRIEMAKEDIIFRTEHRDIAGVILLVSFCIATMMQIGKHLGLKNFILGVVFNIGLAMLTGLLAALLSIGLQSSEIMVLVIPICYAVLWIQGHSIKFLAAKSVIKQMCLSTAQLYSPFLLIYLYGSGLAFSGGNGSTEGAIFVTVLGCVLYLTVLLPYFRKLHLRMRALPSR